MRLALALLLAAAAALLAAPTASAQVQVPSPVPPPPEPTVAPGVTVAGVDASGQTRDELRETLRGPVTDRVREPIVLRGAEREGKLLPGKIKLRVVFTPTLDRTMAAAAGTEVTPIVTFRSPGIRAFLKRFAPRVAVAPVNAQVRIRLTRIGSTRAKKGRRLDFKPVTRRIKEALRAPLRSRVVHAAFAKVRPAVGERELKDLYPSIITIDQSTFTLRLFRRLRYNRSYSVAVGQPAYPTPNGLFAIQSKQVNPTWTAPNSPWAGESAGQSYDSSDPNNPLKARWMGVSGSVGIHGTGEDYSIGTRASHGCIRMHVSDVIDLFDRVQIGTPVLIAP